MSRKYEASTRKLRQLSREIEKRKPHETHLQHSVWKLASFLADEVPGWRESMQQMESGVDDDKVGPVEPQP